MAENSIECPKCGAKISLTDALSTDIKEQYQKEFQQRFSKREAELIGLQETLIKKQTDIDAVVQSKLKAEKASLEKKVRDSLLSQTHIEMEDLKAQIKHRCPQAF